MAADRKVAEAEQRDVLWHGEAGGLSCHQGAAGVVMVDESECRGTLAGPTAQLFDCAMTGFEGVASQRPHDLDESVRCGAGGVVVPALDHRRSCRPGVVKQTQRARGVAPAGDDQRGRGPADERAQLRLFAVHRVAGGGQQQLTAGAVEALAQALNRLGA